MPLRVSNDYSDVEAEWLLGDEGELHQWQQPPGALQYEFDPQKARLFLEYFQYGMTERQACLEVPMEEKWIRSWKRGSHGAPASFIIAYKRAREQQIHCMADDIVDIADGSDRRSHESVKQAVQAVNNPFRRGVANKVEKAVSELAQKTGNRISARKWYVSKVMPHMYGDRVNLEHTGGNKPVKIDFSKLSDEQLEALAKMDKELNGDGS